MLRRNVIEIIVLAGLLPLVLGAAVLAAAGSQTVETTAAVEVRVWQSVHSDALYLSTRPANGPWTTHNTPLDMSTRHAGGNFFLSSIIPVTVPVTVAVDVPDEADVVPDLTTELDPAMESANAWVQIWEGGSASFPWLAGSIRTFSDFEAFDLDIYVTAGRHAGSFCNPGGIRSGIYAELGCTGIRDVAHAAIDSVWIEYGPGLTLSCIRHNNSDADVSLWACLWD